MPTETSGEREMKPTIYKLRRLRYRGEPPLCLHCREKLSLGRTADGALGCVQCQDKVDVYIAKNFDIVEVR